MTAGVNGRDRYTASSPCPICGGHPNLKIGGHTSCWGFLATDAALDSHTAPAEFPAEQIDSDALQLPQ
jgi:hypothetical protein